MREVNMGDEREGERENVRMWKGLLERGAEAQRCEQAWNGWEEEVTRGPFLSSSKFTSPSTPMSTSSSDSFPMCKCIYFSALLSLQILCKPLSANSV